MLPKKEPVISVGLLEKVPHALFILMGKYRLEDKMLSPGVYEALPEEDGINITALESQSSVKTHRAHLVPLESPDSAFTLLDIKIGRGFHWERLQQYTFKGELSIVKSSHTMITAINRISLENYIEGVICSEINPKSPIELLRAHCIISRSWILAQIAKKEEGQSCKMPDYSADEVICWSSRNFHNDYDVCIDDHCQRYQGINLVDDRVKLAASDTKGEVLVYKGEICDTRFSKCCGGRTENFSTAWEQKRVPYLQSTADISDNLPEQTGVDNLLLSPVTHESDARQFITARPKANCNIENKNILKAILPDFDLETEDFFRWKASVSQTELQAILTTKTNVDFGKIKKIVPIARGASGRLFKIRVCGTNREKIIGKELEIRRVLSPSHLLSSAFFIEPFGNGGEIPDGFILHGAGWGHGVGLCQIGAAAMAERGKSYREILSHYFFGAELKKLY